MVNNIRLKYLCKSFSTPITQESLTSNGAYPVYGASGIVGYLDDHNADTPYLGIIKDGAGVGRINKYPSKSSLLGTLCYIVPNEDIDIDWLMYCISAFDLGKSSDGTTIPHIYFKDYGNRMVRFVNIKKQKKIADFLNAKCEKIDATIEKTKATIEEYRTLKQSIITKAVTKGVRGDRSMKDSGIEWIGEIPEEWEIRRIKTLFALRNERNYLPLEDVNLISLYTDKGVVQHSDLESTTGNKATNADGYKHVKKDDIVVNIILCWMGAIGRSAYNGVTSPAYDVYYPLEGVDSRYYHHYFRTSGFSGDCFKRGKGIMLMRWRTYSTDFMDIKVPLPPQDEQKEILEYLDNKTNSIDSLITKKEQIITKLEAYKKSLIYEYVTGKKEVI